MKKAITKTDLVVVLLCCVVIFALSGAAGRAGRMRAQKMLCLSNLRQWRGIIHRYLEDNHGELPKAVGGSENWLGVTTPYVKDENIRLCPSAVKTFAEGAREPFVANDTQRVGYKGSYGFHDWFTNKIHEGHDEWNALLWRHMEQKDADRIPILVGAQRLYLISPLYSDEPPAYESDVVFGGGIAKGEFKNYVVNRHNGSVNGLFMDFSARSIGLKELWDLEWHRNWNPNNDPLPEWPEWMSDFKDYR